ncbi:MAG: hypothetical protein RIB98_15420 [Acidimicrobiales bacterium]
MNESTPPIHSYESDAVLDAAFRQRRVQRLAARLEPSDPASGTARVSARLAQARAASLAAPRLSLSDDREIIDLT